MIKPANDSDRPVFVAARGHPRDDLHLFFKHKVALQTSLIKYHITRVTKYHLQTGKTGHRKTKNIFKKFPRIFFLFKRT